MDVRIDTGLALEAAELLELLYAAANEWEQAKKNLKRFRGRRREFPR